MDYSTPCQVDFSRLPPHGVLVDNSTMSEDADLLVERIEGLLEKLGRSAYWLSMEVSDGRSKGIVTDIKRRGHPPKEPRLLRIAETLGTTTDYLMGRSDDPAPVRSEVSLADNVRQFRGAPSGLPGIPLVGTGDCADLKVIAEDGSEIEIERASFDPDYHVTFIHRPPALRGNDKAYAIYFHGSSMEPRYFAGEVGIADPTRPAGPGDHVIVQLSNGEGPDVVSVLAKKLVRMNSREVVLEQYNPPITFSLPRRHVVRIHRIIPPTEQLLV